MVNARAGSPIDRRDAQTNSRSGVLAGPTRHCRHALGSTGQFSPMVGLFKPMRFEQHVASARRRQSSALRIYSAIYPRGMRRPKARRIAHRTLRFRCTWQGFPSDTQEEGNALRCSNRLDSIFRPRENAPRQSRERALATTDETLRADLFEMEKAWLEIRQEFRDAPERGKVSAQ